jgi:hypothetical protein
MDAYQPNDMLWWDTEVGPTYGYIGRSPIPARFVGMSASGKRARIRVVAPSGKLMWSTYANLTAIYRRLDPIGER